VIHISRLSQLPVPAVTRHALRRRRRNASQTRSTISRTQISSKISAGLTAVDGSPLACEASVEYPALWNHKQVEAQHLYFFRNDGARKELDKEDEDAKMRSDSPDYHVRLAEILLAGYSTDAARAQREDEAHRQIRRALEEYQKLAADSPGNFDHLMKAADGYALVITRCGNVPGFATEVEELNRRLTDELPKLLAAFPDSIQSQWETAMCYNSWGRALYGCRIHLPTTEHAFSETAKILEKLSHSDSKRRYLWIWLASSYAYLGDVQWRLGKPADAETAHRRALTIYDEHAAKIAEDIAAAPFPGVEFEIVTADTYFAYFLASTQREEEAAEHVCKAALNQKRLTKPVELAGASYYLAIAQVQLGDKTGYRETCKALVDVPLNSANDLTKHAAIWTWCLAPAALEDMSLLVERAEEFVATNKLNRPHYALQTLGAVLYRAGQFDRAAEQLSASIAAYPSDPLRSFDTINYTRLLLAMTQWQQGRQDEARHLLAEVQRAIDLELQIQTIASHRRVTLEVLRREAEALIGKNQIEEDKHDESQTADEVRQ
jgi:tetratricopeptide (TPR) repeat protein